MPRRLSIYNGDDDLEASVVIPVDGKIDGLTGKSHLRHNFGKKLTPMSAITHEKSENKLAMAVEFDHMYLGCSDTKATLSKDFEVQHLKDLLLLHLDLIQQQAQQIVAKDKVIQSLRDENENLKNKLDRIDRRVSLSLTKKSSESINNEVKTESSSDVDTSSPETHTSKKHSVTAVSSKPESQNKSISPSKSTSHCKSVSPSIKPLSPPSNKSPSQTIKPLSPTRSGIQSSRTSSPASAASKTGSPPGKNVSSSKSTSPVNKAGIQLNKSLSPPQITKAASPGKSSPNNKLGEQTSKVTSPVIKLDTSVSKPGSPASKSGSPSSKTSTPLSKSNSPLNKPGSPLSNPCSPITRARSPPSKPVSPVNKSLETKIVSPPNKLDSSNDNCEIEINKSLSPRVEINKSLSPKVEINKSLSPKVEINKSLSPKDKICLDRAGSTSPKSDVLNDKNDSLYDTPVSPKPKTSTQNDIDDVSKELDSLINEELPTNRNSPSLNSNRRLSSRWSTPKTSVRERRQRNSSQNQSLSSENDDAESLKDLPKSSSEKERPKLKRKIDGEPEHSSLKKVKSDRDRTSTGSVKDDGLTDHNLRSRDKSTPKVKSSTTPDEIPPSYAERSATPTPRAAALEAKKLRQKLQLKGKSTPGTNVRGEGILNTCVSYFLPYGTYVEEPTPEEEEFVEQSQVEIPGWGTRVLTSLYVMEGTENLEDEIFLKRHAKPEQDEKRRKRWDLQRMREQRHYERLRERYENRHSASEPSATSHGSLWPYPEAAVYIQVEDTLPVCAFGQPVARIPPQEFTIPWLNEQCVQGVTTRRRKR